MIKEHPILFSSPMVKAILDGRKSMTRRVIKPQPKDCSHIGCEDSWQWGGHHTNLDSLCRLMEQEHPYGQRLWVRETFQLWDHSIDSLEVVYKEGWPEASKIIETRTKPKNLHQRKSTGIKPWTPSIYMPRWASRLTLEIVSVRVERLQDIRGADILAEGAVERPHHDPHLGKLPVSAFDGKAYVDLQSLWAAGWDSINGKRPGCAFKDNPFTWAITFRQS